MDSIPGLGRAPEEGNGNPLLYSFFLFFFEGEKVLLQFSLTPILLPGKSHGQRTLAVYSPWRCKRVRHDLETEQQQQQTTANISNFRVAYFFTEE